ncbi:DNA-directed RNA polymerase II subunit RPB2 [Parelaphostrongylus tenuis]|uniref:DNA-directed RNA polymerase II subunit RPB2 n=1 Tax=Parelaphostrongylus tenuis TaxID=148309 RepID=A0AAD5QJ39_PARTN|nr:DNA-directed RNA polymerase II subunit RPB2 [Parelaphostrongylus tenuis]
MLAGLIGHDDYDDIFCDEEKSDEHEEPEEEDEDSDEISSDQWQEACWTVISAYFDEKGLVRQQLDSFDEFIQNECAKNRRGFTYRGITIRVAAFLWRNRKPYKVCAEV